MSQQAEEKTKIPFWLLFCSIVAVLFVSLQPRKRGRELRGSVGKLGCFYINQHLVSDYWCFVIPTKLCLLYPV